MYLREDRLDGFLISNLDEGLDELRREGENLLPLSTRP